MVGMSLGLRVGLQVVCHEHDVELFEDDVDPADLEVLSPLTDFNKDLFKGYSRS